MATKKSAKASKAVGKRMHQFKHGEKMAGGRKIKNPKQAVAIGLDEARRSGASVPPNPNKKRATKKTAAKKAATKKSPTKKTASKKVSAKKTTSKKSPTKKTATKKTTKKAATKKR